MHQSEATFDDTRASTIDWDLAFSGMENDMQQAEIERAKDKGKGGR